MRATKNFYGDSFEDIYHEILWELKHNPEFKPAPRGIGSREITNLSFELTNPLDRLVWNKARDMNYEFAMKFWLWMINGDTDFSYVTGVNPKGAQYAKQDDKAMPDNFSTAYGPRIVKQLPAIIAELKRDPDSRRAVMHILNEDDHIMLGVQTTQEYPCTDSFTWMIRDGKLNMYTHMRSNNMVLTLCYDVFNFTMLHEYVYRALKPTNANLQLGTYYQNNVSAHYFDKEQKLVDDILDCFEIAMTQRKPKPVEDPVNEAWKVIDEEKKAEHPVMTELKKRVAEQKIEEATLDAAPPLHHPSNLDVAMKQAAEREPYDSWLPKTLYPHQGE